MPSENFIHLDQLADVMNTLSPSYDCDHYALPSSFLLQPHISFSEMNQNYNTFHLKHYFTVKLTYFSNKKTPMRHLRFDE